MKRIESQYLSNDIGTTNLWKFTSTRFGVSAYGRTVAEARRRLFHTVSVHRSNCHAVVMGQLNLPVAPMSYRTFDKSPWVR